MYADYNERFSYNGKNTSTLVFYWLKVDDNENCIVRKIFDIVAIFIIPFELIHFDLMLQNLSTFNVFHL